MSIYAGAYKEQEVQSISRAFEEIGRPALVAKGLTDKTPLEVGKEFDLYN